MQNEWKRMLYLGHGLGIAGKINGVRSASPSKQTSTLLFAVSVGLSAGGSIIGGRNHHMLLLQLRNNNLQVRLPFDTCG